VTKRSVIFITRVRSADRVDTVGYSTGLCDNEEECRKRHSCILCHAQPMGVLRECGLFYDRVWNPLPRSIETRGLTRGVSIPCYGFNRIENGCEYRDRCLFVHLYAVCRGDHSFASCQRRDFGLRYTKTGTCSFDHSDVECNCRHWCILCHDKHPFGDPLCVLFSDRMRGR
jgi:hypothetical protein